MEIEAILKELDDFGGEGPLPEEALLAAVERREEITPHLLAGLDDVILRVASTQPDFWLHQWSLYLLAQFRETRAYPLIVRLAQQPSEQLEAALGETLTEDLGRILASVYDGDVRPLQQLAENPRADEYARSAALQALVALVVAGEKTREEVLEYFRHLFHTARAPRHSVFWGSLVLHSCDLYPDLVLPEIRAAYKQKQVDEFFISPADVDELYARGKEATLAATAVDPQYRLVKDVIAETEWWSCFQPDRPTDGGIQSELGLEKYAPAPAAVDAPTVPALPGHEWEDDPYAPRRPEVVGPKPGRNDPCPCGSGLKYKKCCLKK
ncbi:MAG: DUF1186 domain-containing protein [Armatimonadota bacterium]